MFEIKLYLGLCFFPIILISSSLDDERHFEIKMMLYICLFLLYLGIFIYICRLLLELGFVFLFLGGLIASFPLLFTVIVMSETYSQYQYKNKIKEEEECNNETDSNDESTYVSSGRTVTVETDGYYDYDGNYVEGDIFTVNVPDDSTSSLEEAISREIDYSGEVSYDKLN